MNKNTKPPDAADLRSYHDNRRNFPADELAKYAGKFVAFSPDGTRILAGGESPEAVDEQLRAAGNHFSQVVHSYVDGPAS